MEEARVDEGALDSAAEYAIRNTKHFIESFGPREPGSESERKAQEQVQRELEHYADEVRTEPFQVTPKAFMGFLPAATVLLLASAFVYSVVPWLALLLSVSALAVVVLEFGMYKQFLDPFLPKKTSHNVYAVRKASGDAKRTIIVSGHVDSAYEMRFNLIGRFALLGVGALGVTCLVFLLFVNMAHVLLGDVLLSRIGAVWHAVEWLRFVIVPASIPAFLFTRFSFVVPGANDNLTGTFVAMAVMKHLHEKAIRFDNTEVACLITGSEEAGLRGAKAFAKKHRNELLEKETVFLALDTLRDPDHLAVYDRDMSGTVRNHRGACDLLQRAGKEIGLNLSFESVYVGSSDAAAFSQEGIPAVALGGMDPSPPRYYHTRLDDWNNMSAECLRRSFGLSMRFVQLYDRQGLTD